MEDQQLDKFKEGFEKMTHMATSTVEVNGIRYIGLKGDENNSNILHLIADGVKHGYIDFVRHFFILFVDGVFKKLEEVELKFVENF
jgi:hypothetical protein